MLRLKKSLSERIYLLSATEKTEKQFLFRVRGSSNNIYEQVLSTTEFSCSCPDQMKRKGFCKHLLFLIARVAIQMEIATDLQKNSANWNDKLFDVCAMSWRNRFEKKSSPAPAPTATPEGDCSVCFEEMKEGEELTSCVMTCKNYFHKECIRLWLESSHTTCPLCRATWLLQSDASITEDAPEIHLLEPKEQNHPKVVKSDVVFSFDTTGSMSSCISDVRRNIEKVATRLFDEIPELRLSIIAHGDYCDGDKVISILDFTNDKEQIKKFIQETPDTYGGDYPKCYELVLNRVRGLSWRADATMKSLVLIGDAPPHERNENPEKLDWKEEAEKLANRNIQVYSIQCLNRGERESYNFYSKVSQITNGYHLFLNQFSYIVDMIQAVCYRQYDESKLLNFQSEVQAREGGINSSLRLMFDTILGKKSSAEIEAEMNPDRFHERYSRRRTGEARPTLEGEVELIPCHPTKFQVFNVDDDIEIKAFCELMRIRFVKGRGFYEFIKPEIIQPQKEIVLMNKATGDLYEGDVARTMAGIGDTRAKIKPAHLEKYRIFIQTTSTNRKLVKNQGFLYEVAPM